MIGKEADLSFLLDDPVRRAAQTALQRLLAGEQVESVESDLVDCKEDPSKRQRSGEIVEQGPTQHEPAAEFFAQEAACMANSGGGALIVGVDDDTGSLIGTQLDESWLRGRIYGLTDRRLTCAIEPVVVGGMRLLVVLAPRAVELIRVKGKARHRVGGYCVEVDASSWHSRHAERLGYDWSAESSGVGVDRVRGQALDVARTMLTDSGDERALELARSSDRDLLRRLNAIQTTGILSNAAALLFTAEAKRPLIDHRRRDLPGGDSRVRYDRADVSLLESIAAVEQTIELANRVFHAQSGALAVGQLRGLPSTAVREAIANAVAHRDWHIPEPIVLEHVGDSLVVQSPGGFVEGVDVDRLLTTPPRSRNRALAELLRALRIAEREGIGVDRMYRELIRLGHRPPEIVELPGPHVRCALVGGEPDQQTMSLMTGLRPVHAADDLDIVLLIDVLRVRPTVNARDLASVLQKTLEEADAALARAQETTYKDEPLIRPSIRTDGWRHPDFRFGDTVRRLLGTKRLHYLKASADMVVTHVVDFVRRHGRIQTSDYVEMCGVTAPHASTVLARLATEDGGSVLAPGRSPNVGRQAHYVAGPGFPEPTGPAALGSETSIGTL
jgi:ATP-dependent DNA helicase RecG